jgi:hypothetical protein
MTNKETLNFLTLLIHGRTNEEYGENEAKELLDIIGDRKVYLHLPRRRKLYEQYELTIKDYETEKVIATYCSRDFNKILKEIKKQVLEENND